MTKCTMCNGEFNYDVAETTAQVIIRFKNQANEILFICPRCIPTFKGHVGSFTGDMITDRSKKQHYHAKERREKFTKDMHEFYGYYHFAIDDRLPSAIEATELMGFNNLSAVLRRILTFVKEMFNTLYCYDQSRTQDCPVCGMDTPGWTYSKYYGEQEEVS